MRERPSDATRKEPIEMLRWGMLGSPPNRLCDYWTCQAAWAIVAQKSIAFEPTVPRQVRTTSRRSVCALSQAAT